jgi:hypothetical protein
MITKGLADLSIQNQKLLAKIRVRLQAIIDETNRNRVDEPTEELINADTLAQIINYLIKLEFIQMEDFLHLETQFFVYADKDGLKHKDTVFNMIAAHCRIMRRYIYEVREDKANSKVPMKIFKSYK